MQNFMAEAAGPAQNPVDSQQGSWPNPVGSADPGYNSYQSHGSIYTSPPNVGHPTGPPGGNAGHTGGGYGAVYGSNYGY